MSIMNLSSSRMIQHSLPRRLLHNHSGVVSIALFFVFCCVVFSLITSNFLTGTNWLNIIRQSAPLLIVATAMTLVITTGGIDLSVGSTLALVGALSAIALNSWGLPWPVVLLGGLLLGGFVGAINGFFIAYEGIPAFIVTLATLSPACPGRRAVNRWPLPDIWIPSRWEMPAGSTILSARRWKTGVFMAADPAI